MNDSFNLRDYLARFQFADAPTPTQIETVMMDGVAYPCFVNEFWTARQRQAASLHEVAYRACFKPQLPRLFIELLTNENDLVYDPFSGRCTTVIEAGLLGRRVIANDINPLSAILARPRFFVPSLSELATRLDAIPVNARAKSEIDLSMFYHPQTLREIISLRAYLAKRRKHGDEDQLDAWIRMVATNRLTGHSSGFFSVYTLPPNQAVSPNSQIKINRKRKQTPDYRDTKKIILKKSRQLAKELSAPQIETLARIGASAQFLNADARFTSEIAEASVQLTVTSPPFLDVVQYAQDNWLRWWFNAIDRKATANKITITRTVDEWSAAMAQVFAELHRITKPGGWVAFEVGEVRGGKIKLDEAVVPLGVRAGFGCEAMIVNRQTFTKTANIWGIKNNSVGTNTNRIVVFRKPK